MKAGFSKSDTSFAYWDTPTCQAHSSRRCNYRLPQARCPYLFPRHTVTAVEVGHFRPDVQDGLIFIRCFLLFVQEEFDSIMDSRHRLRSGLLGMGHVAAYTPYGQHEQEGWFSYGFHTKQSIMPIGQPPLPSRP